MCALPSPQPPAPEVGEHRGAPAMRTLLGTLWLALACSPVRTTLSKSDAGKAASKTLLEKVGMFWRLASSCPLWSPVSRPVMLDSLSPEPRALASLGRRPVLPQALADGLRGSSFWRWG